MLIPVPQGTSRVTKRNTASQKPRDMPTGHLPPNIEKKSVSRRWTEQLKVNPRIVQWKRPEYIWVKIFSFSGMHLTFQACRIGVKCWCVRRTDV